MNFIEELAQEALKDGYLQQLIYKLETSNFLKLFDSNDIKRVTDKEFLDVLRFADILSRSDSQEARNISLKIIGLLYEDEIFRNDKSFKLFAASVLMKLGNFPSLNIIGGVEQIDDEEVVREKIVKEVMQEAPNGHKIFTDAQYQIFEKLKDSNNYSFSGPTSFGKSFVMESFIEHIIKTRNSSDNIAILVPTRALINQVVLDLKDKFSDRYEVVSHPKVPLLHKITEKKFIFVFTAERLVSYYADSDNPAINYLFVDEAHKLLSDDSRTPLLYHTLYQAARKGVNLYFASPNIPNSGVFLDLFNRNSEDSLATNESPVIQNRYFIDCIEQKCRMLTDYGEDREIAKSFGENTDERMRNMILQLSGASQSIIYCNTVNYTIELARGFSTTIDNVNSVRINQLIDLIKESVHEQYFLIDCLKKGVAFHYGGIPQRIRERIEKLFRDGEIKFLFCTSTLLEGVNLPAKNIFILSSKKGLSRMSAVDFWNLAGRAGRLTKDLGGNIFCCRVLNKKGYWGSDNELKLLENKNIERLEPMIMQKNNRNLYKNIDNRLNNRSYENSNLSDDKKKSIEAYGNILFYQSIVGGESVLLSKFLDKNRDAGRETLRKVSANNKVSASILAQSPNIKFDIQNEVLNQNLKKLPKDVDYDGCLEILNMLMEYYHWESEESGGKKPLIPLTSGKNILRYYALLMSEWINSKPLNLIISKALKYHEDNFISVQTDSIIGGRRFEVFNSGNRGHINAVINQLMGDLENNIRFKIKGYVRNYMLLLEEQGVVSEDNWADYLEYGSTNKLVIEIQNAGFPRNLATFLKEHHADCFTMTMEDNEIVSFDDEKLRNEVDSISFPEEYEELSEILAWE
ncbi:DEAD/DEAH box helicase [Lactococcus lactis]|uniref:DEAD/DEAH box helicase n=1 Tax=Lactococcus lactis TaxID=1358 RepID=UPI0020508408|nr:DEAD/DEAH box helicase [Lactococcus lactis]BDH84658.1 DEAD/DEAH box helicase [Lactococcus lactis]